MKITDLIKDNKKTYLLYGLSGVGIFFLYLFLAVNWMTIVRSLLGKSDLAFDGQPEFFKFVHVMLNYFLWIVLGFVAFRGIIKRSLVPFISVGAGFALSYLSVVVYLIGGPMVADYSNRLPFNSSTWKSIDQASVQKTVRIRMVGDLLKSHKLIGMSKDKVNDLLGLPTNKPDYFSHYKYVYWLGPIKDPFYSVNEVDTSDSEWLVIRFQNNQAVEAEVVRE